jgi:hypothetical protein
MIKASIELQDLRRRIYVKAKAEPSWRFERRRSDAIWRSLGNKRASDGRGGVGLGCTIL